MENQGILADTVTFGVLLTVCADNQLIDEGMHLHSLIESRGLVNDTRLTNSIINFYTKCGNSEKAISLFQNMIKNNEKLDVVTWDAYDSSFNSIKENTRGNIFVK